MNTGPTGDRDGPAVDAFRDRSRPEGYRGGCSSSTARGSSSGPTVDGVPPRCGTVYIKRSWTCGGGAHPATVMVDSTVCTGYGRRYPRAARAAPAERQTGLLRPRRGGPVRPDRARRGDPALDPNRPVRGRETHRGRARRGGALPQDARRSVYTPVPESERSTGSEPEAASEPDAEAPTATAVAED